MKLVGASEAAQILGVEVQRISRYRAQGRLPEPVATLAATPVWNAEDIKTLRERDEIEPVKPVALMGTSEAAAFLGVDKSQIGRWLRADVFPCPLVRLAAGPVWREADVTDFAEGRV